MKAFTGFAIGILAVVGAIAAIGIYLKKKTEKELEYEKFDDIMESDEDFDAFFDEDDEIIDDAEEAIEDIKDEAAEKIDDVKDAVADIIDDIK